MLASGKGGPLEFGRFVGVTSDSMGGEVVPVPSLDGLRGTEQFALKDSEGDVAEVIPIGLPGVQVIVPDELGVVTDLVYEGRDEGAFGLTSADHVNDGYGGLAIGGMSFEQPSDQPDGYL